MMLRSFWLFTGVVLSLSMGCGSDLGGAVGASDTQGDGLYGGGAARGTDSEGADDVATFDGMPRWADLDAGAEMADTHDAPGAPLADSGAPGDTADIGSSPVADTDMWDAWATDAVHTADSDGDAAAPDAAWDVEALDDVAMPDVGGPISDVAPSPDVAPPPPPTCDANAKTGDYCGGDKVSSADPDTLYLCKGPGLATVEEVCGLGCVVAPSGYDDYCAAAQATCDPNAKTGDYCGGDKVSGGDADTLYGCKGPGAAKAKQVCGDGCVVAPPGYDDYCHVSAPDCPQKSLLKWGLCPDASDHLRCAGVKASNISQTIGNAPASAGTHAKDGTIGGQPYCAATDLSVSALSDSQVYTLVDKLTDQGFVAFFRNPGKDGWPSSESRHLHAIYAGVKMKSALQAQVEDWFVGKNGLASHGPYTFYKPTKAQKDLVKALFYATN